MAYDCPGCFIIQCTVVVPVALEFMLCHLGDVREVVLGNQPVHNLSSYSMGDHIKISME